MGKVINLNTNYKLKQMEDLRIKTADEMQNENQEELAKIWKYGRMTIGYRSYDPTGKKLNNGNTGFVSKQSVNYVVKYVTKTDLDHKEYKPKILTSAGIGKGYLKSADANNIWYQG